MTFVPPALRVTGRASVHRKCCDDKFRSSEILKVEQGLECTGIDSVNRFALQVLAGPQLLQKSNDRFEIFNCAFG